MESNRFSSESLYYYQSTFLALWCRNAKPCEVIRFLAPLPEIQTVGLCTYIDMYVVIVMDSDKPKNLRSVFHFYEDRTQRGTELLLSDFFKSY